VNGTYRSIFAVERIVDGMIEIDQQTIPQTILSFAGIINEDVPDTDVAVQVLLLVKCGNR
jgi:hypothetical protein